MFPKQKLVEFRQTQTYLFDFNTAGYGFSFPANTCRTITPTPTDVTNNATPLGWTAWRSFYNTACVVGSKFHARGFRNQSGAGASSAEYLPFIFFMHLGTNVWDFDTLGADVRDEPYVRWHDVPIAWTDNSMQTLTMGFSNKGWFDWTDDNDITDQQFPTNISTATAKPYELAYFNIGVRTHDNSAPAFEQHYSVEVEKSWSVLFSDPLDIFT